MNQSLVRWLCCGSVLFLFSGCKPAETTNENPAQTTTDTESVPKPPQHEHFSPLSPTELTAEIGKYAGKVVLVDYWATYCVPCIKNFPHNKEWLDKYGDEKLVVITMFMDGEEESKEGLEFLKKQTGTRLDFRSSLGGEEEV